MTLKLQAIGITVGWQHRVFRGALYYNTLMSRIDNHNYYTTAMQRHGKSAQGVHWNSKRTQYKRFEVLLGMIDDIEDTSIVDAGCGFGDLYLYMQEQERVPRSYRGLEVMEAMVEEARNRTGCEIGRCDVLVDDLPAADYYICSGAMNILTRSETVLFIRRCFEASQKGFLFNMLLGEDDSLVYNYFQPEEIKSVAEELGAGFAMQKGYLPRDFTVLLTKPSSAEKETQ